MCQPLTPTRAGPRAEVRASSGNLIPLCLAPLAGGSCGVFVIQFRHRKHTKYSTKQAAIITFLHNLITHTPGGATEGEGEGNRDASVLCFSMGFSIGCLSHEVPMGSGAGMGQATTEAGRQLCLHKLKWRWLRLVWLHCHCHCHRLRLCQCLLRLQPPHPLPLPHSQARPAPNGITIFSPGFVSRQFMLDCTD